MKRTLCIIAFSLGFAGAASAAGEHNHAHEHNPLHGGIVTEVKDMDYELVIKPNLIRLYLRDHGKPVDITKATAKLTILVGTDKQEVSLQAVEDRLEASGTFKLPSGTKAVATVNLPGKSPAVARFVVN